MIKYIFCISTGRCGTDYLAFLLGHLSNTHAYHEPKPLLNNEIMRAYLKGNSTLLQEVFPQKLELIKEDTALLYVDTSHIFIKSFGWEIPKHIPQEQIGVIILKRDQEKVVQSTQRVHSGPFSYLGRKWIIVPNGNNVTKPPISYTAYRLCRLFLKMYWRITRADSIKKPYPSFFLQKSLSLLRWYYDETYALGRKFQKKFSNITYVDVSLDEINTITGFEKIITTFGLDAYYTKADVEKIIGKAKNLKKEF